VKDAQTDRRLIRLSPRDNVLVIRAPIDEGESVLIAGESVIMVQALSIGHKLARSEISANQKVIKYGAPIGTATAQIQPGEHVHVHNLRSDYTATHSLQSAEKNHRKLGRTP